MIPEVEALRREVAELRANQIQLADVRAWLEGRPLPSAQNTVEPHSVRDNAIGMLPFCYLEKTANQVITPGSFQALTWSQAMGGSELGSDPYGMHTAGENTVRAPRRGWYLAMAAIGWTNVPAGTRLIHQIVVTGQAAPRTWRSIVYGGDVDPVVQVVGWFSMQPGDVIAVHVHQNSAGNEDVLGTSADESRTKFAVVWQHDNVAPPLPA